MRTFEIGILSFFRSVYIMFGSDVGIEEENVFDLKYFNFDAFLVIAHAQKQ